MQPDANLEHEFSIDGTCFSNTIKANWESMKDEILRLSGKGGRGSSSSKNRRGRRFDKVMIAAGTTFNAISFFAVAGVPTASGQPYFTVVRTDSGAVRAGTAYDRRRGVHLRERRTARP